MKVVSKDEITLGIKNGRITLQNGFAKILDTVIKTENTDISLQLLRKLNAPGFIGGEDYKKIREFLHEGAVSDFVEDAKAGGWEVTYEDDKISLSKDDAAFEGDTGSFPFFLQELEYASALMEPLKEFFPRWRRDPAFSLEGESEVLSFLIMEAARLCEAYQSDLFLVWNSFKNKEKEYFGFRKNGVDSERYITARTEKPDLYGDTPFYSIYQVEQFENTVYLEQIL